MVCILIGGNVFFFARPVNLADSFVVWFLHTPFLFVEWDEIRHEVVRRKTLFVIVLVAESHPNQSYFSLQTSFLRQLTLPGHKCRKHSFVQSFFFPTCPDLLLIFQGLAIVGGGGSLRPRHTAGQSGGGMWVSKWSSALPDGMREEMNAWDWPW